MKRLGILCILLVLFYFMDCNGENSINAGSTEDNLKITEIFQDIDIYDDRTYIIDSDIPNATGSIALGGNSVLKIIDATVTFTLVEDLEFGIYLEDNSKIIIEESAITSNGKMWEFELTNNSTIEVTNSNLLNHSAVKLFNNSKLNGKNSLIEELRMDNQSFAKVDNCEIYPNMQFFFTLPNPIEFPPPYENTDFTIDNPDAWKLDMINSKAQGWQVDVYPGTDITIENSKDVNLGLRSNGQLNESINLKNPHDSATNLFLNEFGFSLAVTNTEIHFINLYLKGNDKLKVIGEKVGSTYNTTFLEIVLLDNAELNIYDSHIFAQLFHANDSSKVNVYNSLIGSTDAEDPIISEFGIKDNSIGYAENCDLTNSDILVTDLAVLTLKDCQYDSTRVVTPSDEQIIVIP